MCGPNWKSYIWVEPNLFRQKLNLVYWVLTFIEIMLEEFIYFGIEYDHDDAARNLIGDKGCEFLRKSYLNNITSISLGILLIIELIIKFRSKGTEI